MHRDVVVIVGKAKAISKAVTVAEILKRSVPGLHQETTIALETSVDRWEPTEQQLDRYGMWGRAAATQGSRANTHADTRAHSDGRTQPGGRAPCADDLDPPLARRAGPDAPWLPAAHRACHCPQRRTGGCASGTRGTGPGLGTGCAAECTGVPRTWRAAGRWAAGRRERIACDVKRRAPCLQLVQ